MAIYPGRIFLDGHMLHREWTGIALGPGRARLTGRAYTGLYVVLPPRINALAGPKIFFGLSSVEHRQRRAEVEVKPLRRELLDLRLQS